MSKKSFNDELMEFLKLSPTPFHAVLNLRKVLEAAGFKELNESTKRFVDSSFSIIFEERL